MPLCSCVPQPSASPRNNSSLIVELGGEVVECYSQGPGVMGLFRKAGAFSEQCC